MIVLEGTVGHAVTLGIGPQPVAFDAHFRWEVVTAPPTSMASPPGDLATGMFVPDRRGVYVLDRWLESGVTEDLTRRFEIDAAGVAPVPSIGNVPGGVIGVPIELDGAASVSGEALPLAYAWRLSARPRDSGAVLASTSSASTT